MEIVLTAILVSVILNTATGGRSIGHNAAIAVGSTVAIITAVRGVPDKEEREAAQGGALPMQDSPAPKAPAQ